MPRSENISMSVIKRLPRYYRFLGNLKKDGVQRISSKELALKMGLTASQIRQDLNCFGGFGQQGYGYNVDQLHAAVGEILGVEDEHKTIIIGMGNLGKAMAAHMRFSVCGFRLIGLFDSDLSLSGQMVNDMTVRPMLTLEDFCSRNSPEVAVLCIPEEAAKEIVSQLIACGITKFWNFSHYDIASNFPGTVCENVHLNDSLMTLNYLIKE